MTTPFTYIHPTQAVLPLTVYYDHSCVLCRSEIENIKARDDDNVLRIVDCSAVGFDTSNMPVDQTTLMNCIHAMDAQGRWLKATDVFVVCYRAAGMGVISSTFAFAKPLMERLYPIIVRNRYTISKLGIHKVFNALTHKHLQRKAKAAMAASQGCKDGVCEMPSTVSRLKP
jgi:predicted DCC family thiol-disulfide oxidoreductase YuxK